MEATGFRYGNLRQVTTIKLVLTCHEVRTVVQCRLRTRMAASAEVVLRPRFCLGRRMPPPFLLCSRCDRGQRYCSLALPPACTAPPAALCQPPTSAEPRRTARPSRSPAAVSPPPDASQRDGSGFPFDRLPAIIQKWAAWKRLFLGKLPLLHSRVGLPGSRECESAAEVCGRHGVSSSGSHPANDIAPETARRRNDDSL